MNGPVEEIRRLRGELAERDQQLAELRGLVQAHIEATSGDEEKALERERAAYERGERDGDEMGWRRGVEHALMAVDDAHMEGNCHDEHGQMRSLKLHSGPVPERLTPEEIVAKAAADGERHAEWWFKEFHRTHPDGMPLTAQRQPEKVREMRPKGRGDEREAV